MCVIHFWMGCGCYWIRIIYSQWMVRQWDGYIVEWGVGGEKFLISMRARALGDAAMKILEWPACMKKIYTVHQNLFFSTPQLLGGPSKVRVGCSIWFQNRLPFLNLCWKSLFSKTTPEVCSRLSVFSSHLSKTPAPFSLAFGNRPMRGGLLLSPNSMFPPLNKIILK